MCHFIRAECQALLYNGDERKYHAVEKIDRIVTFTNEVKNES